MVLSRRHDGDSSVRIHSSDGSIRVEAEALFPPGDDAHVEDLITRLFRLEAVHAVVVDRGHRAIVINYDSRLLPGRCALDCFSGALREPGGSLPPLDRLLRQSVARVNRIVRRQEAGDDGFVVRFEPLPLVRAPAPRLTGVHHERVRRLVNLALGGACFFMSIVGIMTPFVPTMPFVLATGYFLANSSPKLHDLFRRSPLFGEMLTDWEELGGWRVTTKLKLFGLMAILWGVTLAITGFSWPLVMIMGFVSSISIFTIFRVPTVSDADPATILLSGRASPGIL